MICLFVAVPLYNSSSTRASEDTEEFGEHPQGFSPTCQVLPLPEPFILPSPGISQPQPDCTGKLLENG